jgi:hypothetical protein
MADLSPNEYDVLERAVADGNRISVYRRGTEYLVIPMRIFLQDGREAIEARHPTTGERIILRIDDIESFEVVR